MLCDVARFPTLYISVSRNIRNITMIAQPAQRQQESLAVMEVEVISAICFNSFLQNVRWKGINTPVAPCVSRTHWSGCFTSFSDSHTCFPAHRPPGRPRTKEGKHTAVHQSKELDSRSVCRDDAHVLPDKTIYVFWEEKHFAKRDGLTCVVIRCESSAGVQEDLLLLVQRCLFTWSMIF